MSTCARFFNEALPDRLTPQDHKLLRAVGVPVAISIQSGGSESHWVLLESVDGLQFLPPETDVACRFRMSDQTFLDIVAGRRSPQSAFFTGRLKIEGDRLLALKLGSLLESVFRRNAWVPDAPRRTTKVNMAEAARPERRALSHHQRRVIELHFDPSHGAPYWIRWSAEFGIGPESITSLEDLRRLPPMDRDRMSETPFRDFLPRCLVNSGERLILGESGGTMGEPLTLAWSEEDFKAAFVTPLVSELASRKIGQLLQWLFAGPTGPHIIGKAADALATATSGCDALKIDMDPRWHRRLVAGSPGAIRHMEHLREQTVRLLAREFVDALFITPSLLIDLLENSEAELLRSVRLVHLGGQSISPQSREWVAARVPNGCEVINGYGNSLFGCLVERGGSPPETYAATDDRLVIELCEEGEAGAIPSSIGETGRIRFHRFDRSMLVMNCIERDEAECIEGGFRNPRPIASIREKVSGGIY